MLYPILTPSRFLSDLSGVWDFKLDNGKGFDEKWYEAHDYHIMYTAEVIGVYQSGQEV